MDQDDTYLSGLGNEHQTEALAGALPIGRNSPQRPAHGLFAEQLSGTAFTAGRAETRRTWLYRRQPSVQHSAYVPRQANYFKADEGVFTPNRYRWNPLPIPEAPTDFISGLHTMASAGSSVARDGAAFHVFVANQSMDYVFSNHDGEMLILPEQGRLRVITEMGIVMAGPKELILIPRAVKFRVELIDAKARGVVCENFGSHFRLPELGPIGANGLASARDFLAPKASFEDDDRPVIAVTRFAGRLWECTLPGTPFNVVAWHGNLAPYKYDLRRFMSINSVSHDHADPSIGTLLTSPSSFPGVGNVEIAIFPPRWVVAEDTFRPPWFHRNAMCEFVSMISGIHEAHGQGFPSGACSLHNAFAAHGPDPSVFQRASSVQLVPERLEGSFLAVMETRLPCMLTDYAASSPQRKANYDESWNALEPVAHG